MLVYFETREFIDITTISHPRQLPMLPVHKSTTTNNKISYLSLRQIEINYEIKDHFENSIARLQWKPRRPALQARLALNLRTSVNRILHTYANHTLRQTSVVVYVETSRRIAVFEQLTHHSRTRVHKTTPSRTS